MKQTFVLANPGTAEYLVKTLIYAYQNPNAILENFTKHGFPRSESIDHETGLGYAYRPQPIELEAGGPVDYKEWLDNIEFYPWQNANPIIITAIPDVNLVLKKFPDANIIYITYSDKDIDAIATALYYTVFVDDFAEETVDIWKKLISNDPVAFPDSNIKPTEISDAQKTALFKILKDKLYKKTPFNPVSNKQVLQLNVADIFKTDENVLNQLADYLKIKTTAAALRVFSTYRNHQPKEVLDLL